MLRRAPVLGASLSAVLAIGVLATARDAAARPPAARPQPSRSAPRALTQPVRLTAGAGSDLMGILGQNERSLYFVSDAGGTLDIMRQAPLQSAPETISGGLGDAAWPQISPDGKHIAFISFENDATGDVCVRTLEEREAGPARCLTNADSAELVVLWWDDASVAVLSRPGLHGDYALVRLPIDGGKPSPLVARNMVGVALSPDRRWLAYIPIDRATADVGVTFSQRASLGVGLARLDGGESPPTYVPRLPGVTGAVTFSAGGDHLELTQFLNDTNRDGNIDGDDNAVIFRVPFHGDRTSPVSASEEPEQLTSARWDCHYPAPSPHQLLVSCSHEGSLDVYSLPLEGAVPSAWDDARLVGELRVSRDAWTRLLLSARRLVLAPNAAAREAILLEMMALHLELGEYESVIYYAEQRLESPDAQRIGHLIAELARHRRADIALIRGETSAEYVESERSRARQLAADMPQLPPRYAPTAALVISEIQDDIGDKAAALATFQAIDLTQLADPLWVPLVAQRAERLHRLQGDRQALLGVLATLARAPILDVGQRLEYAESFVRELVRGRSRSERSEAIAGARAPLDQQGQGEGELALLLDVEALLIGLDDQSEEQVRAQLFELYKRNKDVERRRALVLATLRAAARAGNEYVQYQFVNSWLSSLPRAHPERKNAETLYNDIVLDRAYGEGRAGKIGESRGYFYGATIATDSLEAHVGFIEARLREGGSNGLEKANENLDQVYEKRFARDPDSPVYSFVKAYRLARELPRMTDPDDHDDAVGDVTRRLSAVAAALPKQPMVHQLWGFALHQRARRKGSREAAVAANRQYLLALDLARDNERLTATLLHRLGLLQAALGNHGAALRYLQRRDELPHVRADEELGLRVALARSAWHTGDAELARAQMQAAMELTEKRPELAAYRTLVVDRLGLALAAAGDTESAQRRYAELDELLGADPESARINQVKAKVGLAATALSSGQARAALDSLSAAENLLGKSGDLHPRPDVVHSRSLIDDYRYSPLQYRALVAGLRTGAERALGDFSAALAAAEHRVQLLAERLRQSQADEDRLELAQAYHHLAELHDRLGDPAAAARAVESGLDLSDQYNASTGGEVNDAELALIRDYAELRLYRGVSPEALRRDARAELERVYAVICKYRNPRWAQQRYLFQTYLTALRLARP
jgi:WD40 repeat protein